MGPLNGIRVLDLSRVLAGPWATQVLADFGAEVLKIEHPEGGDDTRQWGPPYLADARGHLTGESAYFLSANRGKYSVAVDLADPAGAALVRELALKCDVLIENFKVGGLARYGLGYADLQPLHPRLVYCSVSAFGQNGPRARDPGYDAMIQAMGGLMSITGVPDGEAGAGPQKVGVAVVDLMTGMYAATAVLGALFERQHSGTGQYIDLALLDTQIGWLANQNLNYLVSGHAPRRQGTAHPNIVPYQAFATADGHLMLAVGNDRQFASLCRVASLDPLAADSRYTTNAARVANRLELLPTIAAAFRAHPTSWWLSELTAASVPCGPINDIAAAFAEPQVVHRGMRIEQSHPLAGKVPGVKNPVNFSRSALEYRRPAPLLGQHTAEVLSGLLGLSAGEIHALRDSGVIGQATLPPD